jgi:hypothetical protein
VPQTTKTYLVDMSCYADLGPDRIVLAGKNQVTVNTGVREDELDAFLIEHNLMLKTAAWPPFPNFLALFWDVVTDPSPKIPNAPPDPLPDNACVLAGKQPPQYGAPYLKCALRSSAEF